MRRTVNAPPDRHAELAAWAAGRAPELVARAEAEAVAVLRDAMLRAALGDVREPAAPAAPADAAAEVVADDDPGELLWAYCVLNAQPLELGDLRGVDSAFPVQLVEAAGMVALVSRVPRAQFGERALRANLNQLPWLERVARAHEAVLDGVLEQATIVPLRLCTLYESEEGVRRMLVEERPTLARALDALSGREEWGIKLLVDPVRLADEVKAGDGQAQEMAAEIEGQSQGGAYMLRRRLERHVREGADRLAGSLSSELRAGLQETGADFVTRPPQNRELSRHEGEMLVNVACLVDHEGLERVRGLVSEFEARFAHLGARVEITGPWPPYNFVLGGDAATFA